jgi:hypothetical protein
MNDISDAPRPAATTPSFGGSENSAVRLTPRAAESIDIEIMAKCQSGIAPVGQPLLSDRAPDHG